MTHFGAQITPAEFPEMNRLAWNRDPRRPMAAEEGFALYERNWHFVDRGRLTDREARLIGEIGDEYGCGFKLT